MSSSLINHVALVLDASASMCPHESDVVKAADAHVNSLAAESKVHDQETRVTVYTFRTDSIWERSKPVIECAVYDKDVLRTPSIAGLYAPSGRTPLCTAMLRVIDDLRAVPVKYGDHAFLVYLLTDGQENHSDVADIARLKRELPALPENWTLAAFVPDYQAQVKLMSYGFHAGNISVWDPAKAHAVEEVGRRIAHTSSAYFSSRSQGTRGTADLFAMASPKAADVKKALTPLTPGSYFFLDVTEADLAKVSSGRIDEYMTMATGKPYAPGRAYYQMTRRERIQHYKGIAIAVKNPKTGMTEDVYAGGNARQLLGLPDDGTEVRVSPGRWKDYEVFILSTSMNRRLFPGTRLLVMR